MLAFLNMSHAVMHENGRDLTARQLATFLLIYTTEVPFTVRTLAEQVNLPYSAARCVIHRLMQFDLVSCTGDSQDRRRILIHRTATGKGLFARLAGAGCRPLKRAACDPGFPQIGPQGREFERRN